MMEVYKLKSSDDAGGEEKPEHRHQYFTFVPQRTITYIEKYLDERAKQGES